jgi:hypothetical protein
VEEVEEVEEEAVGLPQVEVEVEEEAVGLPQVVEVEEAVGLPQVVEVLVGTLLGINIRRAQHKGRQVRIYQGTYTLLAARTGRQVPPAAKNFLPDNIRTSKNQFQVLTKKPLQIFSSYTLLLFLIQVYLTSPSQTWFTLNKLTLIFIVYLSINHLQYFK